MKSPGARPERELTLYPSTALYPEDAGLFPMDGGEIAPTVTTGAAIVTGATTASLAGSIDPHDLQAHYWFQYGYTGAYGSYTPEAVAGTAPVNVIQGITGIDGAALYHYRLVAWNAAGTTYGQDRSFSGMYGPVEPSFIHESGKGQY